MPTPTSVVRVVAAALALGAILFAVSFVMDDRGYLGTDTGGKSATLEAMVRNDSWVPDVGYWAAALDPEAELHPLYNTAEIGGHYVNTTSLPMILAARPLYELGGYRLSLMLPIAGAVVCGLAARAIADRIRSGSGWLAFWLTGLASPVLVYALDFWEHSIGAGLMAWAVVTAMKRDDLGMLRTGLIAGALVGAASTMRTEALVFGFVTVAATATCVLVARRGIGAPIRLGLAAVVGLGSVLVANAALEVALMGETFRGGRATGTAGAAGGDLALRVREAAITGWGLFPTSQPTMLLFGLVLALALGWLGWVRVPEQRHVVVAVAVIAVLYTMRIVDGLGFVPGLAAATPVAVLGLAAGWRSPSARLPLAIVAVSLPLVWLTQYTGGATPQWGARYLLPAGVIAGAVGCAALASLDRVRRVVFVGGAVVITVFGAAWMSQRTHEVAEVGEFLAQHRDAPLISDQGFWLREVSTWFDADSPWLSTSGSSGRASASALLEEAGYDSWFLLDARDGPLPTIAGFEAGESTPVPGFFGMFRLTEYSGTDDAVG
ncbi:MAG: hypothetical protein JJE52_05875 [Acidimicrobiia bacterium]|nr:hypothetical protein [Acidimicrobiia bacterium]